MVNTPIPTDGLDSIINSLHSEQSANPTFQLADLNQQMRAQQAISIFGYDEVSKGIFKELDNLLVKYGVTKLIMAKDIPYRAIVLDSSDIYRGKTKNGAYSETKCRIVILGNF